MMNFFKNSRTWWVALAALAGALSINFAHEGHGFTSGVETEKKPWTHLEFLDDPNDFQFAIVTDRTGSPRKGVFEQAVGKLNLMQPEFVMTVGDLIAGNSNDGKGNTQEWDEFMGMIKPLEMPFFFLAGNHDIQAKPPEARKGKVSYEIMRKQWEDRFGTTYYYYVYKGVLFLALFTNDGIEQKIGEEQIAYFKEVLAAHQDVRWTMVFLHHPLWLYAHESNFDKVEEMLKGRKHTVMAGHQHRYLHLERNNANYYVLATTGGGSPMRGTEFGEFDHVTWVTMKDEGPVIANLRLDGILPHDINGIDKLRLNLALTDSAKVETETILGKAEETGSLFMTFSNDSTQSMKIKGSFDHHHSVIPDPANIKLSLEPMSSQVIEVSLNKIAPIEAAEKQQLKFVADYSLNPKGGDTMSMKGSSLIPLENSDFDLIGSESRVFVDSTEVSLREKGENTLICYTLDGSDPNKNSSLYTKPIKLENDALLKTRLFSSTGLASRVSQTQFDRIEAGHGLLCDYFEFDESGTHTRILPNYQAMDPVLTLVASRPDPNEIARRERTVGMVFYGYIEAPQAGEYTFHLRSDDGARLLIGGKTVIEDPIKHPPSGAQGTALLNEGKNRFELQYFQFKDALVADLEYTLPSGKRMAIPLNAYSFDEDSRRDGTLRRVSYD